MKDRFRVHHGPVTLKNMEEALGQVRRSTQEDVIELHQKYEDSKLTQEELATLCLK